ncbi:efflux RND transporter periplasmic adaptor subunit [Rhizobium viscosum]|uniref:RND family efflux transporter MFP subunit n=1 Tax=Rhizobium viscosum TaxID=1673 RepID=A0ABR9J0S0_RHIVS|nr:RND family efflux transporter MFP subunit [Rhizobium viscosum]
MNIAVKLAYSKIERLLQACPKVDPAGRTFREDSAAVAPGLDRNTVADLKWISQASGTSLPDRRSFFSLIVLILGAAIVCPGRPALSQQTDGAALTVAATKPVERQWSETVPASGWLRPWHEAISAAEVGGLRITDVLVDVGSVVRKGQPLARLSDETVRAELRKEEAALATAKADLAKAETNAERARRMQGSGVLSDEKINEYLIAEQTAAAGVDSAEASLESQRIKLSQTTITAVDDGLITSRSAQLGAVVASGTELFRLVRQQRIEWQAEVSARYRPLLKEGLAATIFDPGGQQIRGTVRLVAPTVSTDTGRALVYVSLPPEAHAPIGLYATGQIEFGAQSALTVPDTALVTRDGMNYVFTLDGEARARRVRVEIGRRNSGDVEILSGLDRSAQVITTGGAFLSDGALLRVEGAAR